MVNVFQPEERKMNQSPYNVNFSYTNWRAGFLRLTLIGACIFGLAALIPGLMTTSAPIYSAIYIGLYAVLLLVTIIGVPYVVKAGLFIGLIFILGVAGLLETGIWGDSRVFMLGAIVMASLLFSWKAGWAITGLTMLSYLITGWLVLSGSMTITNPDVPEGGIEIWASGSTAVLLLAVLMVNGIRLTQDEFGKAQDRAQATLDMLQNEKLMLEQRVENRTRDLAGANQINEHRAKMFQAIAQVTHAIISTQNLQDLLPQVAQAISEHFGFYHIGIFLLDPAREYAILSAANSEEGQRMLDRNHKLPIGHIGIVSYVAGTAKPRIALDTDTDTTYIANPDLPKTRSEMALPLIQTGGQVIGVLDIQSTEPNAFKQEDIGILFTLADQVSVAIANARLYEETQKRLIEAQMLYQRNLQAGWKKFTNLQKIAGIRRTGMSASIYTEAIALPGATEVINSGVVILDQDERGSHMMIPVKLRGEIVGILNVKADDNRKWTRDDIDIVAAIVERAALSIENSRLLVESQRAAEKERVIGEISARIGASTQIETILKTAMQELGTALPDTDIAIQFQGKR